jgi:hypothetical protein
VSLEQESRDPKRDKWANLDILRIVKDQVSYGGWR